MIRAKSASPAQIARALHQLGLRNAKAESLERQIRRTENDPELNVTLCFHPFARQRLLLGRPQRLLLILDPTTQDDRLVMLTAAVWYRGRALPLAWAIWPANISLQGDRFWVRVAALLDQVAQLLPAGVPVVWIADRAFGTPTFIDLVVEYGWDYLVRVQGHTRCRDRIGKEYAIRSLVPKRGHRTKLTGMVFKKAGWREASLVVYWASAYASPLCLVSSLTADWGLIMTYRRRYPIEATFRHYKSYGWQWEQGQVTDLVHMQRLLVAMALATWIVISVGSQVAHELLRRPSTGKRRTLPWEGKRSLFTLGLDRLQACLSSPQKPTLFVILTDWDAPNWSTQLYAYHARAFIFALFPAHRDV
jgi:hypothetical protein